MPTAARIIAAILVSLLLLGIARYPLSHWPLSIALAAYCIALWYRPVIFLLVLPVVLPAWDLGIWTGWMMVGESDLFVVATLAVLLVRTPPTTSDLVGTPAVAAVLGTVHRLLAHGNAPRPLRPARRQPFG